MKMLAAALALVSLSAGAEAQERKREFPAMAPPDVRALAPALADYTDAVLFGDVWQRAELAPRDRSLVTISALIAGGHTGQMTGHFNRALDNGLTPREMSEVITHLAFYAGWPRAMSAVPVANDVFAKRGIGAEALALLPDAPLPLDAASEASRAASVATAVGDTVPALASFTNGVLFGDLWRRPDLAPRDRSLVTMVALIANGQAEQLPFHVNRAMDSGMTQSQVAEVITHLAFYAGWPRAMSAVPVAKAVFAARGSTPTQHPPTQARARVEVLRAGSQPSTKGASDYFVGAVKVDSRFQQNDPARIGGGIVTFEPGARTAWHTHPLGQTLIVTEGLGLVQREGDSAQEIGPGDIVWIPPNTRHWHGATPTTAMTHVAISEAQGGSSVVWMEQVTQDHYAHSASAPAR